MADEIERKFLVRTNAWRSSADAGTHVVQGYLSSNAKATVRVRIYDDERAVITIKGPTEGISRREFEYDIPFADAQDMLALAEPHIVQKRRYTVPFAGLLWEVDVFEGAHAGLVVAEVELEHADQAVVLPDWIGEEVSHDDRYANASLSRMPGVPAR
ncbi:CYTH domain-containing protein [Devosia sp. PTR5]|uniref:CYTH domain-containing protein n=1 Tax=Devosia oryzisoli TaxID=2774138 RepID=A0A927FSY8_9HYPH|nr:CYTH domain-containing protein [Devosia oryzisoli]MBD8064363.1 CYTH domain-containing protein [Devosia oryzisoli]